jgi:hypothetical protein
MAEMTDHERIQIINKTLRVMLNSLEELTEILKQLNERMAKLEELLDAQRTTH